MKTVYHASPYHIKKFEIPHNGLHFGTKESALQAVAYKRYKLQQGRFYLHKIVLDTTLCEEVFDVGMDWREYLDGDKSKVFSYTNKYEPSTGKSFVIFDTKFIKDVRTIETLCINDFESDLDDLCC